MKVIDIKSDLPTVSVALERLQKVIQDAKHTNNKCICIIHGYGSTGKGGRIRTEVRKWLNTQLESNYVKIIVYGEKFAMFDQPSMKLHQKYPKTDIYYDKHNRGITIIEV